jgi:CheY-like chemotaxis protein
MARHVLFIDDDTLAAQCVRHLLEREGIRVSLASNGKDGLDLARRHQPDLILLDVMMPGMDGFQVCREVRQDADLQHVSVVMLTAMQSAKLNEQAFSAGAEACLTKPFQPHRLLNAVHMALQNAAFKRSRLRTKPGG